MPWRTSLGFLLLIVHVASAEVVKVDVRRRDDVGTHERVIGRVHFAIDPRLPANRGIADIDLAPKNADGKVEFSSDLLFFRPKQADRARGTVFLEVVNRGPRSVTRDHERRAAAQTSRPSRGISATGFLLEQGFAVAFLGWQFDVQPSQGLTFQAPVAPVEGLVRDTHIEANGRAEIEFGLAYCAIDPRQQNATLTFRASMDAAPQPIPRDRWRFADDGCSVRLSTDAGVGIYEVGLSGERVAGGWPRPGGDSRLRVVSAIRRRRRDTARDAGRTSADDRIRLLAERPIPARVRPRRLQRRRARPPCVRRADDLVCRCRWRKLQPSLRDAGRRRQLRAFSSAAGRFAALHRRRVARAGPSGAGDAEDLLHLLVHRVLGARGIPHAYERTTAGRTRRWRRRRASISWRGHRIRPGGCRWLKGPRGSPYQHFTNFAQQRWVSRALLLDLDAWAANKSEPPSSQYPSVEKGELVALKDVHFPKVPSFPFATYMPQVWRMDYGSEYGTTKVITIDPPRIEMPYLILVPQVNADGNDVAGIRLPEVAAPLGTYTGWNITIPQLSELRYLSGLVGAFEPFPLTKEQREQSGDARLSVAERYTGRQDYLDRVKRAADDLVRQRFMLAADVPAVVQRAEQIWNAVMSSGTR